MVKNYLLGLVFYYVYVYVVLYSTSLLFYSLGYIKHGLEALLILHLTILALYFIGSMVSFIIRGEDISLDRFGLRRYGSEKSIIYSAAISAPILLFWLIGTRIVGLNTIMLAVRPSWAEFGSSTYLLGGAVALWLMTSIIAFIFWIAVPYELSRNFSTNRIIPIITILWAGLYNTPFLTGKLDVVDIFFFGLLYSIVYHRTGSITGPILSYLIVENPLWWVVSTAFPYNDEMIFIILLIVRLAVCILALAIVITKEISIYKRDR